MANVEFPYIDKRGNTKVLSVNDSTTRIDFANKGITSINLEPIRRCLRLRDLLIYDNELVELDLSPLGGCNLLRSIVLRDNRLRSLDLSPLSEHMDLERIDLRGNQLQSLNVDPLANHQNLEKFQIDGNPLLEIDISALITCRKLKEVGLDRHMKIKASRNLQDALQGTLRKYKKTIIWIDRAKTQAPVQTQGPVTSGRASSMALGVLKSVPRISMEDLTQYTNMTLEETRELVFLLVGEGKVAGRYEAQTDEFISLEATQTIKELRSDEVKMQKCRHCGKPLPRILVAGDRHTCEACGNVNEG
ncbi:MAG: hypothetical protein ACFFED_07740 [Candidatus Thorarchaeota archaeon]